MTRTGFLMVMVLATALVWVGAEAGDNGKTTDRAVKYLLNHQHESGGWPQIVGEGGPEAETTTWAVNALALTVLPI